MSTAINSTISSVISMRKARSFLSSRSSLILSLQNSGAFTIEKSVQSVDLASAANFFGLFNDTSKSATKDEDVKVE